MRAADRRLGGRSRPGWVWTRSVAFVVLAGLLAAGGLFAAAPAQAAAGTCGGVPATIVSSASHIYGTSGHDVILVQGGGSHVVVAYGGHDIICLPKAVNTVWAGPGNDTIYGSGSSEWLYGQACR